VNEKLCAMALHPTPGPGLPDPEISPFFGTEAAADAAMTYFYGRLFASDPEIRAMFPAGMTVQRRRLYSALCRIAAGIRDSNAKLEGYLAELGRAHRKFGVRPEHYDAFRAALEATFLRYPPDDERWPEQERADALRHATKTMASAAGEDSGPAWWTAEVVSNELRTSRVTVLTLRPAQPYPYRPGQHATVQTPRWPRIWRCYSIANAPGDDETITLHIRVVPGGMVSTALLHAGPGDNVLLGAAEGTMTADTSSPRDALCLAGGTGLAPVKAITEALLARGAEGGPGRAPRVTVYFGARTEADLYDLPALRAMELASPALEVRAATSEEHSRRVVHGTIATLAADADWADRDIYISGPDAMIARTVRRLRDKGVPRDRLRYDLPGELFA
jgi:NAD(P)H-flavin reductase/hemoglobin-like flavoprotein